MILEKNLQKKALEVLSGNIEETDKVIQLNIDLMKKELDPTREKAQRTTEKAQEEISETIEKQLNKNIFIYMR